MISMLLDSTCLLIASVIEITEYRYHKRTRITVLFTSYTIICTQPSIPVAFLSMSMPAYESMNERTNEWKGK